MAFSPPNLSYKVAGLFITSPLIASIIYPISYIVYVSIVPTDKNPCYKCVAKIVN